VREKRRSAAVPDQSCARRRRVLVIHSAIKFWGLKDLHQPTVLVLGPADARQGGALPQAEHPAVVQVARVLRVWLRAQEGAASLLVKPKLGAEREPGAVKRSAEAERVLDPQTLRTNLNTIEEQPRSDKQEQVIGETSLRL
jgi:hypothetical protein